MGNHSIEHDFNHVTVDEVGILGDRRRRASKCMGFTEQGLSSGSFFREAGRQ